MANKRYKLQSDAVALLAEVAELNSARLVTVRRVELIRSRGQFPKGGYDVHNGGEWQPATPATVQ